MGTPTSARGRLLREVEILARVHTTLAIDTLAEICESREAPEAARVQAAKTLLDRGWGKAPQTVSVDLDAGHLTDDDLERQIARKLATIAHSVGGGSAGHGAAAASAGAEAAAGPRKPPGVVH